MAGEGRWYFTKEEINNSPSRKCGIDAEKELSYRQQGAKLIQDMGQKLQVTQLVINTAIVYMHRFYMFHPFTKFHRNCIGPAAIFLAAKVEEQPRKLEHVIKVSHIIFHHDQVSFDTSSESYLEKAQELVMNENILLQTLGFDVAPDHPHTHVVKCFQMVRGTTELAQTSYFMATNSLHMTTMCLQYKPAVVACVCIFIVCKWSKYEIQRFTEGKDWFSLVDPSVTLEMLEALTKDFLVVLDKYPSRLKKLRNSGPHGSQASSNNSLAEERARPGSSSTYLGGVRPQPGQAPNAAARHELVKNASAKNSQPSGPSKTVLSHKEYSEKKEKERRERTTVSHAVHAIPQGTPQGTHPPRVPQPCEAVPRVSSRPVVPPVSSGRPSSSGMMPPPHPTQAMKKEVREERLERPVENCVDNNNTAVKHSDKAKQEHRHSFSAEWNHANKNLDHGKNRKVDNSRSESKTDAKLLTKDNRLEREVKYEPSVVSSKSHEMKNVSYKSEPPQTVKVEVKEESKASVEDLKAASLSSFFSSGQSFNMHELFPPSAMLPDDIFDTENDLKAANEFYVETTHRKLRSPVRQGAPAPPPTSVSATRVAVSSSSVAKAPSDSSFSSSNYEGRHPKVVASDKAGPNLLLAPPPRSRKEKVRSPVLPQQATSTHNNAPPKSAKITAAPDSAMAPPQQPLEHSKPRGETRPSLTLQTMNASGTPVAGGLFSLAGKVAAPAPTPVDLLSSKTTLSVRLPRLELTDVTQGEVKKHKHDSHHKHKRSKERKKHKDKDKERHKEKHSRDHKEHKRHKKSKKHKDARHEEREAPVCAPPAPPPVTPSASLKIILRKPGTTTPDVIAPATLAPTVVSTIPAIPTRTVAPSAPPPVTHSPADPPGRIKLTIPKSRLQGAGPPSPPRGIPPPKKAKSRDQNRKRDRSDRSPPRDAPLHKMPRQQQLIPPASSPSLPQQVLDPSRWSSQRQ